MARRYTPAQAAAAMRRFERSVSASVVRGMRSGLVLAQRYAVTERMVGGGKHAPTLPDKLRIRTGNLRRTVAIVEPRPTADGWTGGLKAGGPGVPQAAIHEHGGRTAPHTIVPRNAAILSWIDRSSGERRFARKVHHPGSRIPARPYLRPSLEKTLPEIQRRIDESLKLAATEAIG